MPAKPLDVVTSYWYADRSTGVSPSMLRLTYLPVRKSTTSLHQCHPPTRSIRPLLASYMCEPAPFCTTLVATVVYVAALAGLLPLAAIVAAPSRIFISIGALLPLGSSHTRKWCASVPLRL